MAKLPVLLFGAMFLASVGADTRPPTVQLTSPLTNARNVPVAGKVSATFSEALKRETVTESTVMLHDPSRTPVLATVLYDFARHTALVTPDAPLAYSSTYSARLSGGARTPHITDLAGNALAQDFTWSFTTSPPPSPAPDDGPGGPVLVLSAASNPFSRYPGRDPARRRASI